MIALFRLWSINLLRGVNKRGIKHSGWTETNRLKKQTPWQPFKVPNSAHFLAAQSGASSVLSDENDKCSILPHSSGLSSGLLFDQGTARLRSGSSPDCRLLCRPTQHRETDDTLHSYSRQTGSLTPQL